MSRKLNIYIAGPDVFFPEVLAHAEQQRWVCIMNEFNALHPVDNDLPERDRDLRAAMEVYRGNLRQIKACDIVVANCNPFRSPFYMDHQTSLEIGVAIGMQKIVYGHIASATDLKTRVVQNYPMRSVDEHGVHIDRDGNVVEDFITLCGVMPHCGIIESGGRIVVGTFEDCIITLRADINAGRLVIPF